jgi:SSS family solute:Na+ symporter
MEEFEMNMHLIDWAIVACLIALMAILGYRTKKLTQSVADFLAANRTAGRYLVCIAGNMSGLGAISIVACFEMYYDAGFSPAWWDAVIVPAAIILAMTGFVVFRFRQTRAITISQFFEMRYSRNFRIFSGMLAWLCGIINFGIFPSVGARFFVYFCGLPQDIHLAGLVMPTFALIMLILLCISLFLTFGGQITVMVTDFVQGVFTNLALLLIVLVVLAKIGWPRIADALLTAPDNASLVHPFKTSGIRQFGPTFFLINIFGMVYSVLAWQSNMGFDCAAKSPHEARMAKVIWFFRDFSAKLTYLIIPIGVYALLHHPSFAAQAQNITAAIGIIDNPALQKQMTVPIALGKILPVGAMGAMCAVMFCAFVANHNTYMHSWGSIFIQDVIMPLRAKPLSPDKHLKYLRRSIFGVAVFIFCFSLFFRHTSYIMMFFAVTGVMYVGGAGSVIIGGLYWKRGTTGAAWSSMITGAVLSIVCMVIEQVKPDFILTGQEMFFFTVLACIAVYVLVSLLGKRSSFNLDQMLHRGSYALNTENQESAATGFKVLAVGKDFTRGDKIIYSISLIYIFVLLGIFVLGTVCGLLGNVSQHVWLRYWHMYIFVIMAVAIVSAVWITIGGLFNLKEMFVRLNSLTRDHSDNGSVVCHTRHLDELKEEKLVSK